MKRIIYLSIIILFAIIMTSHAQLKNPRNLDFTWKTDTTIHSIDVSEITLVLPKGSFPKIDYPYFLEKRAGLDAFFAHEPVISVEIDGNQKILEFEVSGMLRKSDMVMLDTDTESLWQQLTGATHMWDMIQMAQIPMTAILLPARWIQGSRPWSG